MISLRKTKHYFRLALVTCLVIICLTSTVFAQTLDNKGKEFIVSFTSNLITPTIEVHLTSDVPTDVTVEYPVNSPVFEATVAVNPGAITIVEIPNSAAQGWPNETVANNSVRLSADQEFVTYMANRAEASSDAALALPVETMNTEYIVMTYNGRFDAAQFVVTAAFNNTNVTITPSNATQGGQAADTPFNITLNRGEAYMVRGAVNANNGGLAGSIVTSDKPVGLSSGNGCTQVPLGVQACDAIFQVGQPVQSWGNEVLVVNLPNRPNGSIYRILASEDNTNITQNGVEIATINRGEFHETPSIAGSHVFAGNKPIYVVQFMTGVLSPGATLGDPAMGNMIPTAQFLNDYTFSTVGGAQFEEHYVTIVANNADLATIALNGSAIGAAQFTPVAGTQYSSAIIPLADGTHSTSSLNPHGITVQGYDEADSYIYPGGARFQFINPSGDDTPPVCQIQFVDGPVTTFAGSASDEGAGIFFVELLPGSQNANLIVDSFVPGEQFVTYTVEPIDPELEMSGTVRVTDGAGNFCESDLASDPECTGTEQINILFAMDGGALAQRQIAYRAARRLRTSGVRPRLAQRIRVQAQELYDSAWSAAWALPTTVYSCLQPEFCLEADLTGPSEQYRADITQLRRVVARAARRLNRRGLPTASQRLRRASARQYQRNLNTLQQVPASSTVCN